MLSFFTRCLSWRKRSAHLLFAVLLFLLTGANRTFGQPVMVEYKETDYLSGYVNGITYGNGRFVAVTNNLILSSTNGINWFYPVQYSWSGARDLFEYGEVNGVIYDGKQFLAVGNGGRILTSPDGILWQTQHVGTNQMLTGMASSGSQYVAVGYQGGIITSGDGVTWTIQSANVKAAFWGIAYGNGQFVAVGNNGILLTSPDGVTWTQRTANTGVTFRSIIYAKGQFMAVGDKGTIITSADGITWTQQTTNNKTHFRAVIYGGGQYVVVGENYDMDDYSNPIYLGSAITTSPDGITWSGRLLFPDKVYEPSEDPREYSMLFSVAYGGGQYVAGTFGTIKPLNLSSALPVQLMNFTARAVDRHAQLQWQTAQEIHNKGFEVLKSTDANNYQTIGWVDGLGTSLTGKSYAFTDEALLTTSYYCLQQVDEDGHKTLTRPVAVVPQSESLERVVVYPNPSLDGRFQVVLPNRVRQLSLTTAQGHTLQRVADPTNQTLDLGSLASGVYWMRVESATDSRVLKLVKP